MTMNVTLRNEVKGLFRIEAFKPDAEGNEIPGTRRVLQDWTDNLITNGGLDMLGTSETWAHGCVVGTDNTAPTNTDTALGTFFAGTTSKSEQTRGVAGSSPYYGWHRQTYRFNAGTCSGTNITEVGISQGGATDLSPLFMHALVNSGTGVTVLADESLDVIYEFRRYPALTDVTGTFAVTVTGGGTSNYDYTIRAADATTVDAWANATMLLDGFFITDGVVSSPSSSNVGYSGAIGAITTVPSTIISGATVGIESLSAYTNGNYYRDMTVTWGLSDGNDTFRSFLFRCVGGAWQMEVDPTMAKDNTMLISWTLRVAWARRP
jgi:hypothetical protein